MEPIAATTDSARLVARPRTLPELDSRLICSIAAILLLATLQLSWPSIQAYFASKSTKSDETEAVAMPIIETIDHDPVKAKPKKRFVKPASDIANWASESHPITEQSGPLSGHIASDPESGEREGAITVDENGSLIDIDGSIISPGEVAYIRQQIIDRVIHTGIEGEDDSASALMKVDIIKSVKELSDADVLDWYSINKDTLKY